jgi:hypothetical protein
MTHMLVYFAIYRRHTRRHNADKRHKKEFVLIEKLMEHHQRFSIAMIARDF